MKKIVFILLTTLILCFSTSINAEELGQASTSSVIKSGNRDFITIVTEDNKTYYLIIDYDSNTNNVYFLKQVEESDLSSLVKFENLFINNTDNNNITDTNDIDAEVQTISEDNSLNINENNTTNIEKREKKIDIIKITAIILLIVLIIYILYSKIKPKKSNNTNGDDYFDEDEDNEYFIERLKNKKDRKEDIF